MLEHLRTRVEAIFADYACGRDVSPAQRYRTEGFAEALIRAGVITEAVFAQLIAEAYSAEFKQPMPDHLISGVCIPLIMQRAPVYPSTSG